MSVIAELQVNIGADIKRLERGLSKAQRRIQDAGRSMSRVGRSLTMAVTAPLAGVGGMALKTAADFESLQQSMNILNGSVEEGTRNFERLQEFSATTPFQLRDLAEAQNMLQGFGQSADDAFESMQMIGDIAAVASGDIKGIGIAFGQAAAEGRLMTRDIRQLINQGVPAIKLLADTMGVAQSEVLDLASEGEISFEILQQSFREATSEGGMFANGMAKQAETLAGRFSTMKDNISLALGDIGSNMGGLAKNVMGWVIDMSKAFRDLSGSTKQMITTAGLLAAAIPPLIYLGGKLVVAIGALISPVGAAIAAIAGLVVIGKNLYDNWNVITANLKKLWDGVEVAAWMMVNGVMEGMTFMAGNILRILSDMAGALQPTLVAPMEVARQKIQAANDSISQSLEDSKSDFIDSSIAANKAENNMTSLADSFWSITDAIKGGLTSGLGLLSDQLFGVSEQVQEFKDLPSMSDYGLSFDMRNPLRDIKNDYNADLGDMSKSTEEWGRITEAALGDGAVKWQKFKENFKSIGGDMQQFLAGELSSAFLSFGKMMGKSIAGVENQWQTTFEKIIMVVLDFAESLVRLAAGVGAVMVFFNPAMGAGLLAAATALQAAITGVQAGIKKRADNRKKRAQENTPALAQGGLAFGPTLAVVGDNANARSNPEVIAPLDKLQGMMASSDGGTTKVEGVIRGSDIHLANARGKNKFR